MGDRSTYMRVWVCVRIVIIAHFLNPPESTRKRIRRAANECDRAQHANVLLLYAKTSYVAFVKHK
jgi:hypothetical protein